MTLKDKEEKLINILKCFKSCAVAFSGGTDSTLLLYYLSKLNIKTKAYTFHSYLYPDSELKDAEKTAINITQKKDAIYVKNICFLC